MHRLVLLVAPLRVAGLILELTSTRGRPRRTICACVPNPNTYWFVPVAIVMQVEHIIHVLAKPYALERINPEVMNYLLLVILINVMRSPSIRQVPVNVVREITTLLHDTASRTIIFMK